MKKEEYILMFKNDEILSFEVVFDVKNSVRIIKELEHYDKAPLDISKIEDKGKRNMWLLKFFNDRAIPGTRYDYQEILKATNCRDGFELSFKGHGLSLANHYWFKKEGETLRYEDINFFSNRWDDSFAKAILYEDYEALKHADLNIPDITTSGWASKAWLYEDGTPVLYKLGISKGHYEEQLGESLASSLGRRLLGDEVLEYKLKEINGRYASVSKCMINENEELIPLSSVLPLNVSSLNIGMNSDRKYVKLFLNTLLEYGYKDVYQLYTKILILKTLFFANDFHLNNVSVIRNINTGEIKMAPIYDLGGAYGGSENGRQFLSNINLGTLFIIYFHYGMLDEDWDYSWYDPSKLEGFEDEIKETLSKSDFYTKELIDSIIYVYNYQKKSLNSAAQTK